MHDHISVSGVSSWTWSLDEDLSFYEREAIENIGVAYRKLDATEDPVAAAKRIVERGHRVTNLLVPGPFSLDRPDAWPEQRELAALVMDTALVLQPETLVFTTGSAGRLPWERAADALEEVMRSPIAEADREGIRVALEHTNSLRTDVGFVHTLRDAIELGWRLGTGVCMEINACWSERNLGGTIAAGVEAISVVQISDVAIGTRMTPDRLVPGDGDIPLGRIVNQLLDAGYDGVFDIEIVGPHIEDEGYESAITRSIAQVEALLEPPALEDEDADSDGSERDSM
jgi:sugar phosphate isomerase/epimerase